MPPIRVLIATLNHNSRNRFSTMQRQVKTFGFSDQLDTDFLKEVYEGDMEYAADIFEIFLETFSEEYSKLKGFIETEDCSAIRAQAHKMKPTFSMVGLTSVTELFKALETAADKDELSRATELHQHIDKSLSEKIPLIIDQQQQLLAHLKNS